jgi:hypothetical protein
VGRCGERVSATVVPVRELVTGKGKERVGRPHRSH